MKITKKISDPQRVTLECELLSDSQITRLNDVLKQNPDKHVVVMRFNGDPRNTWRKFGHRNGWVQIGSSTGCYSSPKNYHSTWANILN